MEYYESYYRRVDTLKNLVEKSNHPKALQKYLEILCKNYYFDPAARFF